MANVNFSCDRCKQRVEGYEDDYFTAGFYRVGPDSAWYRFSRAGENRICDECMFSDPDYQAIYGRHDAAFLEGQQ